MTTNGDELYKNLLGIIENKQSFVSGFLDQKKRKKMGLPDTISFKKRYKRRRGKQNLRKKGK